jgi:hypothetical protein
MRKLGICAVAWTIGAALMSHAAPDLPNAARRSTEEGVFSSAEAARGEREYRAHCSSGCHGPDLTGGERVPSLAGDSFLTRWRGRSVGDLYLKIKLTMPQTQPQSLSDGVYLDLVAFLLDANGLPSGSADLKFDEALLKAIIIKDPAQP